MGGNGETEAAYVYGWYMRGRDSGALRDAAGMAELCAETRTVADLNFE